MYRYVRPRAGATFGEYLVQEKKSKMTHNPRPRWVTRWVILVSYSVQVAVDVLHHVLLSVLGEGDEIGLGIVVRSG